ncbi:MAG TPA: ATP-binding protein [Drouetiella sp.]|jgi:signal transduction histidine kinase
MNDITSVLLIEDSQADAKYVQKILPTHLYRFVHVDRLERAREAMQENSNFDVILLDLSLPDESGLSTIMSTISWANSVPIVILTGLADEDLAIQAVKCGAQDYICKQDLSGPSLSRTIRYAIERKQHDKDAKRLAVLEKHEEFMATLTHDLKNPLIGNNMILELMAEQVLGVVSAEQASLLLNLRDSNSLLISMIQSLIDVYRFEKDVDSVKMESVEPLLIIDKCMKSIAPIAMHRQIKLSTNFADSVETITADADAFRRVMQNLLDNALKFTPDGGAIGIDAYATNGSIVFKITDSGPGIPKEEQSHLFERFAQGRAGKKFTPGIGLGLYLCKQLVCAHRGEISCSSDIGCGTTFTVKLPQNGISENNQTSSEVNYDRSRLN